MELPNSVAIDTAVGFSDEHLEQLPVVAATDRVLTAEVCCMAPSNDVLFLSTLASSAETAEDSKTLIADGLELPATCYVRC